MGGSASWVIDSRPVISTENSTTRLADPKGERNRSEPRYFTFSDVNPCIWDGTPVQAQNIQFGRSGTSNLASSRSGTQSVSGNQVFGEAAPSRILVLNPDIPRERLIACTNSEGVRATFADIYTREYLFSLPVIFLAAARGNSAITYLLLKYGAVPSVTDAFGNTPLHITSCQMNVPWESVMDFLEFGAAIAKPNNMGCRPLDLQPSLVR